MRLSASGKSKKNHPAHLPSFLCFLITTINSTNHSRETSKSQFLSSIHSTNNVKQPISTHNWWDIHLDNPLHLPHLPLPSQLKKEVWAFACILESIPCFGRGQVKPVRKNKGFPFRQKGGVWELSSHDDSLRVGGVTTGGGATVAPLWKGSSRRQQAGTGFGIERRKKNRGFFSFFSSFWFINFTSSLSLFFSFFFSFHFFSLRKRESCGELKEQKRIDSNKEPFCELELNQMN